MSDLEKISTSGTHTRQESRFSDNSNPVSDYEYFSLSTGANAPPSSNSPAPEYSQYEMTPSLGRPSPPLNKSPSPQPLGTHPAHYRNESPERHGGYPEVVSSQAPQVYKGEIHHTYKDSYGDKEAYTVPAPVPVRMPSHQESSYQSEQEDPTPRKTRSGCCGMSKKVCCIVAFIILAIVAALAIGLGVGLSRSKSSSTAKNSGDEAQRAQTLIGGSLDPRYYSKEGAFNGTGVAIASVNFGIDASIFVFYQKYNGDIVQMIYQADGNWRFVTTVATNARNGTALSTVAYIVDSVATWHLFYFDENRYLKQRVSSNASDFQTNIWQDGPINQLNLRGNDAQMVGMQACYWGNYYGSETNWDDGFTPTKTSPKTGMNLWYGADNSTFEQYDWTHGDSQWNHSRSWSDMNTHAGVGCQSWLSGTTYYVMLVDQSDTLRVYWKDTNTNETSTSTHPIDTWSNTSIAITDIHPSTSIGYTDFMAYQASDYTFHGVNISWAAENTTIAPAPSSKGGISGSGLDEWALAERDAGIPGSHMAITGLDPSSGGRQEVIFYQQVGNDIRMGRRDAHQGDFTFNNVPVDEKET